jgi:hypothetical protein
MAVCTLAGLVTNIARVDIAKSNSARDALCRTGVAAGVDGRSSIFQDERP